MVPRAVDVHLPEFLRTRVLPSHDPDEVRRALLSDLLEATEAEVATVYSVVRRDEEPFTRAFGVTVMGTCPAFEQALLSCEGQPIAPISSLTSVTSTTRFESQHREEMPPALVAQLWDPSEVHSSLGVNVLDDAGVHIGWVGAFRRGDAPRFPRRVPPRVSARLEPYRDLLIAAHRMARGGPGSATVIMDERGAVLGLSADANRWLALPGFKDALVRDLAMLHEARVERHQTHFRSAAVTVTRVEGVIGRAYVVTVAPQKLGIMSEVFLLSPAQRAVAELAGLGLKVTEIAQELGRSPETVRSHLRAVYEQLGIASRAELAIALTDAF